ncbi:tetratricopeptide repeat protein [Uliginosibacterium sediminicola]|uniref:Tetratricopeptide repeat protein n=1 Tax=Uliginosibacterium sediminicola TaxID=2024550 RepID=A0ABU9YWW9_9RHOO
MSALLAAVELHQRGERDAAARAYREIACDDADYAGARNNLGVLLIQQGDTAGALQAFEEAVAANADYADAWFNLGKTRRRAGDASGAVEALRTATALAPQQLEIHYSLVRALRLLQRHDEAEQVLLALLERDAQNIDALIMLGDTLRGPQPARAVQYYERALKLRPDDAVASNNLGTLLTGPADKQRQHALYEAAVRARPDFAEAHNNLGNSFLNNLYDAPAAIARYRHAVQLRPDFALAWCNLGNALRSSGQIEEAHAALAESLRLAPEAARTYNNLGILYQRTGRLDEAEKCYRRAIALDPLMSEVRANLAVAQLDACKLDEAEENYRESLRLDPASATARFGMAVTRLLRGDLQAAWEDYEARWEGSRETTGGPKEKPPLPQAQWNGEPGSSTQESILIYHEQGLGDSLQFVRYLPLLLQRFNQIVAIVQPELLELCRASFPARIELQPSDQLGQLLRSRHFDWQCPLLSLPRAFASTAQNLPRQVPYLLVPQARRLPPPASHPQHLRPLQVGLCFAGNPKLQDDNLRSMPPELFSELFKLPGIVWHGLTRGAGPVHPKLPDVLASCKDFADSAAIIEQLDLVISVDTAVAHLSAALGRPVFLLNRFSPDWRWGLGHTDSVWYPNLRQFRQRARSDWSVPLRELRGALLECLAAHADGMLKRSPEQSDALHMRGIVHALEAQPALAAQYMQRAARSAQGNAEIWLNLARLHLQQGQREEAIGVLRECLQQLPTDAAARYMLAELLAASDAHAALGELQQLLQQQPQHLAALSLIAALRQDDAGSIPYLQQACALRPNDAALLNRLALALRAGGREAEAEQALRQCLQQSPQHLEALANLGRILLNQGQYEEALQLIERASAIDASHPSLATAYLAIGRYEAAQAAFARRLSEAPNSAQARLGLALIKLAQGDWLPAWPDFEARWQATTQAGQRVTAPQLPWPQWRGEADTQDKRLLVHAEQGFGDTLNFLRYLPPLQARFAQLSFACQPELLRLLRASLPAAITLLPLDATLPRDSQDYQVPLLSLPGLLASTPQNLPPQPPLRVPAGLQAPESVCQAPRPRIGVCWQGSSGLRYDALRSLPQSALRALFSLPGISWVALCPEQRPDDIHVIDPLRSKGDFADTAAILAELDLLISVDTAIAHLAAGMGRPVWLLNRYAPDWRWGLTGADCVWYPSLRQFRQRSLGDWRGPLGEVEEALLHWLQAQRAADMPNA